MSTDVLDLQTARRSGDSVAADGFDRSTSAADLNEFNYRPVPSISAVGLVMAILSGVAVFLWMVLPLCLVAAALSGIGLWITRRSAGAYGGQGVAIAGLVIATLFFFSGIAFQVYAYQTEVPQGYERVNFVKDISDKKFVQENGVTKFHPDVEALIGKDIFIKGFIYQTGQLRDLKAFLFVKDNENCCFGANPALWDRIGVYMADGKSIDYCAGKVAVSGKFKRNDNFDPNDDKAPIYLIECDKFSTRVSDF
ncbi:hypothetical protein [Planctomicrobium sp. SH664]|uniref:hypothetical protein n=1 Tax=Planctomicrobium sp. SH664 TaxID=3448125 RepID=UPI003F5CB061